MPALVSLGAAQCNLLYLNSDLMHAVSIPGCKALQSSITTADAARALL
jgi:hypothetical protein